MERRARQVRNRCHRYLAVVLLLFMGCSSPMDDQNVDNSVASDGTNDAKADLFGASDRLGPIPSFEGPYELTVSSKIFVTSKENPNDPPTELSSGITGIAQVSLKDDQVTIEFEPCHVTLPTVDRNEFSIPPASVQQLPTMTFTGTLTAGEEAYQLKTQPAAFVAGATLDAPLSETLPEDDDAPTVVDSEGDDHPGITILVRGSYKIFSVVRVIFQLDGAMGTDRIWSGRADLELDISVLGDKIPLHNAKRMIDEQMAEIEIAEQSNQMQMTPIDASLGSCERLHP